MKIDWNAIAAKLRRAGLSVVELEIGAGATEDDFEVLRLMEAITPPTPIVEFFRAHNGVKLGWSGTLDGRECAGSINVTTIIVSALRTPANEEGAPLEGVLWNDEFPAKALRQLKRMAIFENIAGRSACLTYSIDEADGRLFLVDNDRIEPIIPDFETTLMLLARYAGADGLREHLVRKDWQKRIAEDPVLQRIAAL